MENMQINIYIIGSLSQADFIKKLAKHFKENACFNVKYVHEKNKPIETIIHDCFDTIEWSQYVIAVQKPDNSLGRGTLYEIEYATRLGKPVCLVVTKS